MDAEVGQLVRVLGMPSIVGGGYGIIVEPKRPGYTAVRLTDTSDRVLEVLQANVKLGRSFGKVSHPLMEAIRELPALPGAANVMMLRIGEQSHEIAPLSVRSTAIVWVAGQALQCFTLDGRTEESRKERALIRAISQWHRSRVASVGPFSGPGWKTAALTLCAGLSLAEEAVKAAEEAARGLRL